MSLSEGGRENVAKKKTSGLRGDHNRNNQGFTLSKKVKGLRGKGGEGSSLWEKGKPSEGRKGGVDPTFDVRGNNCSAGKKRGKMATLP